MEQNTTTDSTQLSELQRQHHHYDELLNALAAKPYLSAEEELEETRLKKLKLQIKDQMSHMHTH
jgi:hypothetical protein